MKRAVMGTILMGCAAWPAFGQAPETPAKFEIADVHVSAKSSNQYPRTSTAHAGRYEVKNATMVDLVRTAYGFDADKVLGGPSWLEMDRFDVTAKLPAESTPETQKPMLQALLADRFKLVVHKESKPLPLYALTVGKKPQLRDADGSEEAGCKPQASSGPQPTGGAVLIMGSANGATTRIALGPGMTIQFNCRNITMAAFVEGMRGMLGSSLGNSPVVDETGLKGRYNFDLRYSLGLTGLSLGEGDDRITLSGAIEKQLGLKLEERQVPTPVIVVDSVDEKPTENPPGLAEALPPIPVPTEFEVASVKAADTSAGPMMNFQMQPGGRFTARGMTIQFLLSRAFNINNSDQIAGLPSWANSDRFDIMAKAAVEGPSTAPLDMDTLAPMLRALLAERFKMTYHTEDRPVTAYSLVSAKPKMKKADPASRTWCKNGNTPPGAPPRTRVLSCQNITMAQFADRLQNSSPELNWPVLDATGIEGGWDFTLTYAMSLPAGVTTAIAAGGRSADAGPPGADMPAAAEPTGGLTIFEAAEKQLGLKLEGQKRPMPIIVIDHIEQKPTEN